MRAGAVLGSVVAALALAAVGLFAAVSPGRPGIVYHGKAAWMNLVPPDERYLPMLAIAGLFLALAGWVFWRGLRSPDLLTIGDEGIVTAGRHPRSGEWRLLRDAVVRRIGRYRKQACLEFWPTGGQTQPLEIALPLSATYGLDLLDDIEGRMHRIGHSDFAFSDEVRRLAPKVRLK